LASTRAAHTGTETTNRARVDALGRRRHARRTLRRTRFTASASRVAPCVPTLPCALSCAAAASATGNAGIAAVVQPRATHPRADRSTANAAMASHSARARSPASRDLTAATCASGGVIIEASPRLQFRARATRHNEHANNDRASKTEHDLEM